MLTPRDAVLRQLSAGDICEARPCDPGKNALKVGGKLPLPLHHGLQDSPAAGQHNRYRK